jgi:hypothetical protein
VAMTSAERQARYLARLKAGIAPAKPARRPLDRRSKPGQWVDALTALESLLDGWQAARAALPENLTDGAYATKLDAMEELREHVEALKAAEIPMGFGRD